MCGIAGSLHLKGEAQSTEGRRARLEAALSTLAHRGPDGSGVLVDGRCALVMRASRSSISRAARSR
jgi:asparagine synthase (glutamine-hydrolysing)